MREILLGNEKNSLRIRIVKLAPRIGSTSSPARLSIEKLFDSLDTMLAAEAAEKGTPPIQSFSIFPLLVPPQNTSNRL